MNKIREDISRWPIEKRVEFLKQAFKKKMGYELNLDNPRTFSEKIQWIKLFYHDPQMSQCADKVTFKEYIKEKLGRDDLTAKLYQVWESPEEVDLSSIPERCAIKSNCSSDGWNIKLVTDKSQLDMKAVEAEIKESWFDRLALHTNSFANYYYAVKPKVYVEEYLADFASGADDYDVLCFHGEPKVLYVKSNHFDNGRNLQDYPYTFYSPNWERLDVKYAINPTLEKVERPEHLEEMLEISSKLSKDFPFVRVDFYEHGGKLRIAEFSFAPYAGMVHYEPEEFDREMGKWLDMENIKDKEDSVKRIATETDVERIVHNMYQENYKDALFFMKKASEAEDEFAKRKYLRAAAVFYVACIDAWLAQKARELLEGKNESLCESEKEMLDTLRPLKERKKSDDVNEIRVPDRHTLANLILGKTKIKNKKYVFPNEFNELKIYRDCFVHYADSRYEQNYNVVEINNLVGNGKEVVKKIMTELGYPQDVPSMYER